MEGDVWSSFAHDPRDPAVASLRASDADREVIHGVLAEAFADGRLDRAEYDERSSSVLAARTLGELPPVVADLVPVLPARRTDGRVPITAATPSDIRIRAEDKYRDDLRGAFVGLLGSAILFWTIWFVVDGSFPWPAIINAVALMNLVRVVASKREIVRDEVRRLERKQAKELARAEDPENRHREQ
ncbi:DUF1707 SHOCT-like domain-containing protein [Nocardioides dilutus]